MSHDETRHRPPPFPRELLDRERRPRALLEAERYLNTTVDRVVDAAVVELLGVVQAKISEAVGLLDIGRTADARALLNHQVCVIDQFSVRSK